VFTGRSRDKGREEIQRVSLYREYTGARATGKTAGTRQMYRTWRKILVGFYEIGRTIGSLTSL